MKSWNPVTHPFCENCQFYESEGRYIYQLERDPKERMCQHTRRCLRVAKLSESKQIAFVMPKGAHT